MEEFVDPYYNNYWDNLRHVPRLVEFCKRALLTIVYEYHRHTFERDHHPSGSPALPGVSSIPTEGTDATTPRLWRLTPTNVASTIRKKNALGQTNSNEKKREALGGLRPQGQYKPQQRHPYAGRGNKLLDRSPTTGNRGHKYAGTESDRIMFPLYGATALNCFLPPTFIFETHDLDFACICSSTSPLCALNFHDLVHYVHYFQQRLNAELHSRYPERSSHSQRGVHTESTFLSTNTLEEESPPSRGTQPPLEGKPYVELHRYDCRGKCCLYLVTSGPRIHFADFQWMSQLGPSFDQQLVHRPAMHFRHESTDFTLPWMCCVAEYRLSHIVYESAFNRANVHVSGAHIDASDERTELERQAMDQRRWYYMAAVASGPYSSYFWCTTSSQRTSALTVCKGERQQIYPGEDRKKKKMTTKNKRPDPSFISATQQSNVRCSIHPTLEYSSPPPATAYSSWQCKHHCATQSNKEECKCCHRSLDGIYSRIYETVHRHSIIERMKTGETQMLHRINGLYERISNVYSKTRQWLPRIQKQFAKQKQLLRQRDNHIQKLKQQVSSTNNKLNQWEDCKRTYEYYENMLQDPDLSSLLEKIVSMRHFSVNGGIPNVPLHNRSSVAPPSSGRRDQDDVIRRRHPRSIEENESLSQKKKGNNTSKKKQKRRNRKKGQPGNNTKPAAQTSPDDGEEGIKFRKTKEKCDDENNSVEEREETFPWDGTLHQVRLSLDKTNDMIQAYTNRLSQLQNCITLNLGFLQNSRHEIWYFLMHKFRQYVEIPSVWMRYQRESPSPMTSFLCGHGVFIMRAYMRHWAQSHHMEDCLPTPRETYYNLWQYLALFMERCIKKQSSSSLLDPIAYNTSHKEEEEERMDEPEMVDIGGQHGASGSRVLSSSSLFSHTTTTPTPTNQYAMATGSTKNNSTTNTKVTETSSAVDTHLVHWKDQALSAWEFFTFMPTLPSEKDTLQRRTLRSKLFPCPPQIPEEACSLADTSSAAKTFRHTVYESAPGSLQEDTPLPQCMTASRMQEHLQHSDIFDRRVREASLTMPSSQEDASFSSPSKLNAWVDFFSHLLTPLAKSTDRYVQVQQTFFDTVLPPEEQKWYFGLFGTRKEVYDEVSQFYPLYMQCCTLLQHLLQLSQRHKYIVQDLKRNEKYIAHRRFSCGNMEPRLLRTHLVQGFACLENAMCNLMLYASKTPDYGLYVGLLNLNIVYINRAYRELDAHSS